MSDRPIADAWRAYRDDLPPNEQSNPLVMKNRRRSFYAGARAALAMTPLIHAGSVLADTLEDVRLFQREIEAGLA